MDRPAVRVILGIVLLLIGAVWTLQGVGVLGGSPMTGSQFWTWAGGLSMVVGALVLIGLARR